MIGKFMIMTLTKNEIHIKKIKNPGIYLMLIITCSCSGSGQQVVNQASTDNECSEKQKTGALISKNVKPISLDNTITKESGQVSVGQYRGYTFNAQAGEKLSYRTSDDICLWVYTPDNNLLSSLDLPTTGKYIVQVSALKGATTYNLEMTLGSLQAAAPTTSPSPDISSSTPSPSPSPDISSSTPSPSPDTSSSDDSSTEVADFTEQQANDIVRAWYKAKRKIVAPPFDESLVEKYATGRLYYILIKSENSIENLKKRNAYYTFDLSQLEEVISFDNSGARPSLTVKVHEKLKYTRAGIVRTNQDYTANVIYYFKKDSSGWKIYDYTLFNKRE